MEDIKPGQAVWCRTKDDRWVRMVARSRARFQPITLRPDENLRTRIGVAHRPAADDTSAVGYSWMAVAVSDPDAVRTLGSAADWINWPTRHVSLREPRAESVE